MDLLIGSVLLLISMMMVLVKSQTIIECNTANGCEGTTITCPNDYCLVRCTASESCLNAVVECPSGII